MFLKIVLMLLKSTLFMPCLCIVNTTWFNYVDCIMVTNTTIRVIKQRHVTHVVMVLLLDINPL